MKHTYVRLATFTDIRPDCHHEMLAGLQMFDELAERSLMSPLAGMKHTYVRLATLIDC